MGMKGQREPRQPQVFTRLEKEEPKVQTCAGARERLWVIDHSFTGTQPKGKGGGRRGPLDSACAGQKGPTLGSGLPLLDAPPPKRGEGRSCLNPPPPLLPRVLSGQDQGGLNINITHV